MKKILLYISMGIVGIFLTLAFLLYFNQEKIIFFPTKTPSDFTYNFNSDFEEIYLTTPDSKKLHALYFKVDTPKGVVYYLHGNSGNLEGWGDVAQVYLDLNYNVFILDYRGFGKSEGQIENEEQFFQDAQLGYDFLKNNFAENQIVVVGYSIGTAPASFIAYKNSPQQLILNSPFYNLKTVAKRHYPFIPRFLLKYSFDNQYYVSQTNVPISIYHGNQDKVLFYEDHSKIKDKLKPTDRYITLENQGHQAMNENSVYREDLKTLLP